MHLDRVVYSVRQNISGRCKNVTVPWVVGSYERRVSVSSPRRLTCWQADHAPRASGRPRLQELAAQVGCSSRGLKCGGNMFHRCLLLEQMADFLFFISWIACSGKVIIFSIFVFCERWLPRCHLPVECGWFRARLWSVDSPATWDHVPTRLYSWRVWWMDVLLRGIAISPDKAFYGVCTHLCTQ